MKTNPIKKLLEILISVKTHIGYGSPRKQDSFEAHGSPLGPEEVTATKKNLGWPLEPKFFIPEEVRAHFQKMAAQGKKLEEEWKRKLESCEKALPGFVKKWKQSMNLELPEGWAKDIPDFPADPKGVATRAAGGKIMNALAPHAPFLIGGSADLNPSTNTVLKGRGNFQPPRAEESPVQGAEPGPWSYSGANIHFGVREHAMGSILNGMALHGGILPYGSTFLIFSDYMRPAIRLAALMKLRVLYVFTHDSVALGEDGPTHQPVEHIASLRAIPGLTVIRPADANEAAEAWKVALQHKEGPVALLMTRQAVPVIDRTRFAPAEGLHRGAYVLADSPSGRPEVLLMATGSEVEPALAAFQRLGEEGISGRLVSMPSWELFEKQPEEYKNRVIPREAFIRVSMEAGTTQGWHKYIGPRGEAMGIDHFGASAPAKVLLEKFGITAENIMRRVKALLAVKVQK